MQLSCDFGCLFIAQQPTFPIGFPGAAPLLLLPAKVSALPGPRFWHPGAAGKAPAPGKGDQPAAPAPAASFCNGH